MIIQSPIFHLLYSFLLFLLISSCSSNNNSIKSPDISNIDIKLKFIRSDRLLFKSKGSDFNKNIKEIEKEHHSFLNHFSSKIMQFKAYNDSSRAYLNQLEAFINHKDIYGLFLDCDSLFSDMENEKTQLENAF